MLCNCSALVMDCLDNYISPTQTSGSSWWLGKTHCVTPLISGMLKGGVVLFSWAKPGVKVAI